MNAACVVQIKGRFFYEFGKIGQVKTAWSLPGGRLFCPGSPDLAKVVKALKEKGKKFEVMVVAVVA